MSKNLPDISEDDVERVRMRLEMEQLRHLCDDMDRKEGIERAQLLKDALSGDNSYAAKQLGGNMQRSGSHNSGAKTNRVVAQDKTDSPLNNYAKKNHGERKRLRCLERACRNIPRGHLRGGRLFQCILALEDCLKRFSRPQRLSFRSLSLQKLSAHSLRKEASTIISSPLATRIESEGLPIEVTHDSSSKMVAKQSANTGTSC